MADCGVTVILPKPSPQLLISYLPFIVASGTVTLGFFPPLRAEQGVADSIPVTHSTDDADFNAGL